MYHKLLDSVTLPMFCCLILFITKCKSNLEESHWNRRESADGRISDLRFLWNYDVVTRVTKCAIKCQQDRSCISFFFNLDTTQCQGHSIVIGNLTDAVPQNGTAYFIQRSGKGYIGDLCLGNEDCMTVNSECRDGQCWCSPGYSFFPSNRSCDSNCSTYGSEYTTVLGYFLHGNNVEVHSPISLQQCAEFCANATSYLCKTFEYGLNSQTCGLQEVTYLDMPGNWYTDELYADWSHYQRDCV